MCMKHSFRSSNCEPDETELETRSSNRLRATPQSISRISETSETASSCSYTPYDRGRSHQRRRLSGFLADEASQVFSNEDYWRIAERNLNFVLENQNPDGSWPYAVDGVRDFVDHFHTCFVMKALAKIHALTGHEGCDRAPHKRCGLLPEESLRRRMVCRSRFPSAPPDRLQA